MLLSKAELKAKLMKEYEDQLEKTLNEGYGKTLWELEDEVQEVKDHMGQELMEAKLKIKKNQVDTGLSEVPKGVGKRHNQKQTY
jgi:hypothetical protein